jgi:hypothetical protein
VCKGKAVRSTIIGFQKLGVEGTLKKGRRFKSEDTMGMVAGLHLHLLGVSAGVAASIKLTDSKHEDDLDLLEALGYSRDESVEVKLDVGTSFDFRGYRVSLRSSSKSVLPTGSERAVVVVDLIPPPDVAFANLRIGCTGSPLHPKMFYDLDHGYGIEIAAPKIVLTENKLVGRDDFHGLAPSSARVMIAGSWHLTREDIGTIQKAQHKPVRDTARIIVVGPTENDRQLLHVEALLADIGDKGPVPFDYGQDEESDPDAIYPTSWGGVFTVDIGDKIATQPGARGVFKVWAEIGDHKSSELQIELRPEK